MCMKLLSASEGANMDPQKRSQKPAFIDDETDDPRISLNVVGEHGSSSVEVAKKTLSPNKHVANAEAVCLTDKTARAQQHSIDNTPDCNNLFQIPDVWNALSTKKTQQLRVSAETVGGNEGNLNAAIKDSPSQDTICPELLSGQHLHDSFDIESRDKKEPGKKSSLMEKGVEILSGVFAYLGSSSSAPR